MPHKKFLKGAEDCKSIVDFYQTDLNYDRLL